MVFTSTSKEVRSKMLRATAWTNEDVAATGDGLQHDTHFLHEDSGFILVGFRAVEV